MYKRLRDVPYVRIPRISSGISELDWIYGGDGKNWGFPQGKISLWSGPSGTGKSRSLIKVAKAMSQVGHKVIYFQNEVSLSDFRAWTGTDELPPTFYGSEATSLAEQRDDIIQSRATIAIVDSVNQINEFGGGHKAAIKKIYDVYREVTKRTGVHVIFICQLDKQNLIKGGAELLFLADIAMSLGFHVVDKKNVDGHFTINVGNKHRYGKMGEDMTTLWQHDSSGVECISNNRRMDANWCNANNVPLMKRSSVIEFPGRAPKGHKGSGIIDPLTGKIFYAADKITYRKKKKFA